LQTGTFYSLSYYQYLLDHKVINLRTTQMVIVFSEVK